MATFALAVLLCLFAVANGLSCYNDAKDTVNCTTVFPTYTSMFCEKVVISRPFSLASVR